MLRGIMHSKESINNCGAEDLAGKEAPDMEQKY